MRAFNVMRLMRDMGYAVEFRSERAVSWDDPAIAALNDLGIPVHAESGHYPRTFLSGAGQYHAVIVCRYHLAEYWLPLLVRQTPWIRRIFDTVDLHHLREQREAELRRDRKLQRLADTTRARELLAISRADTTWVVSTAERERLHGLMPTARIGTVANLHDIGENVAGFGQRQDFLFVGSAQHPPNVDAARWLADDIFPSMRKTRPDARLHMVGAGLESAVGADRPVDGIIWHGHVPDLDPLLSSCRAAVAPLRFGAGVKGKISQAMAHGLPVITTACGAEGMHLEHGRDVLIADSATAFAQAALRLHEDEALWSLISRNGQDNVRSHFSTAAIAPAIEAALGSSLAGNPSQDRSAG